ncbi:MAG: carbohydrate porin [Coraliomargaritaceae bacterium]
MPTPSISPSFLRCIHSALFLFLFLTVDLTAEVNPASDPLVELRNEIARMRQSYEAQIQQLENRVLELESERSHTDPLSTEFNVRVLPTSGATHEERLTRLESDLSARKANSGLEYSGYFRSGFGVDGNGQTMASFKAPNAQSKYRLGNETETYVETKFAYHFPELDLPEDTHFHIGFLPAYVVPDNQDATDSTFSIREAYAMAEGVWDAQPSAKIWAGQRYYHSYSVHMNDFFYLDMSGYGGGVESIDVDDWGSLSIAWLGGTIDELQGSTEIVDDTVINAKNSLDLRLSDLALPGGEGMVWINLAHVQDTERPNGRNISIDGGSGAAFGLLHEATFADGGYNRAMIQYGFRAAANFRSNEPDFGAYEAVEGDPLTKVDYGEISHFRLVNDLVLEPSEKWSLQATALYDHLDVGLLEASEIEWWSFGLRPIYQIDDYLSLALEAGFDHTDSDLNGSGELYKFTIAPQIAPGKGYFQRPVLRFFMTYALWSDDFEGLVAPDSYADETEGFSAGVQAEAWW